MSKPSSDSPRLRWARLRFSIIGPLLASPPKHGELAAALTELAAKPYRHPSTGEVIRFGASTLERWFYLAQKHPADPVGALARKVPAQAGTHPSLSVAMEQVLRAQHREHPCWSYQLHYDNLVAVATKQSDWGAVPSYPTVSRFMKSHGLVKQRRRRYKRGRHASDPFTIREVRSFEVEHVHALWHADFHIGSRRVLLPSGEWAPCVLFGALDDRSRLCCHLQWYLQETAEVFVHGLSQAILKRGLPRSLLTDNGSAMLAAETTEGLERLGIVHYTTLPYSPEQNAKQECFWGQVEGRLLPMLESRRELTLPLLNEATQAWVELEYHRRVHSEIRDTPLTVARSEKSVERNAPDTDVLRHAFRTEETRAHRRSDGTISVRGTRFEIPSRYRTLLRPTVRFARWDLSSVDLVDARTGTILCALYPLDKRKNANRKRRALQTVEQDADNTTAGGIAPHLENLMADYAATGCPPAYLPHHSQCDDKTKENES